MYRVALMVLVAACAEKPDHVIELGILEYFGSEPMIDVPRTAIVGEPIVVNVTTYGGCDISSAAYGTDVESDADGAVVFPLDRRDIPTGEGASCPLILLLFGHTATLTFDTPGTKTIRIQGRRIQQDVDEEFRIGFPVVVE